MPWPSDLVLEGGDQFRGWFRSSLITAVAIKGRAPYRRVMKNGWVNDEQGRPMSKSREPASTQAMQWPAGAPTFCGCGRHRSSPSTTCASGPTSSTKSARVYRNLRNRMRFMLSNLDDLSAADVVAREAMEPIDRLACSVDRRVRRRRQRRVRSPVRYTTPICASSSSKARCRASSSTRSRIRSTRARPAIRVAAARSRRCSTLRRASLRPSRRCFRLRRRRRGSIFPQWRARPDRKRLRQFLRRQPLADAGAESDLALWRHLRALRARVAASAATARLRSAGAPYRAAPHLQTAARAWRQLARGAGRFPADADLRRCGNLRAIARRRREMRALLEVPRARQDPEHPEICADCARVVRAFIGS